MSLQTLNAPSRVPPAFTFAGDVCSTTHHVAGRRGEQWSPWTGGQRPSTAAEETAFTARLRALAGADAHAVVAGRHERHHVTAIVTALRISLTADEMLRQAPGLRPAVVLAAYDDLEERRARSENAWHAIVATPSAESLECFGATAAQLLPAVISRLVSARLRRKADAAQLAEAVHLIDQEIRRTSLSARLLEDALSTRPMDESRDPLGQETLYDACGDGVWNLITFLPPRVGTLVPARVAGLLEEARYQQHGRRE